MKKYLLACLLLLGPMMTLAQTAGLPPPGAYTILPGQNLQTLVNTVDSAGGGTIIISPGTYGTVTLPDDYLCVNLIGSGTSNTTIGAVTKGNTTAAYGCEISNLTITGSLSAATVLNLPTGKGWWVHNILLAQPAINGTGMVIGYTGASTAAFYEGKIEDIACQNLATDYSSTYANLPNYCFWAQAGATDNQNITNVIARNVGIAGVRDDANGDNTYLGGHTYGSTTALSPQYDYTVASRVSIDHLESDGSTVAGVDVRGYYVSISNGNFFWGTPVSGAYAVKVESSVGFTSITGNQWQNITGNSVTVPVNYVGGPASTVSEWGNYPDMGQSIYGPAVTFFAPGAASTPGVTVSGLPYTAGTATTNYPHVYFNSGSTAPTTWSTSGTYFGMNAPSGWAGNFIDLRINGGGSLFNVSSAGSVAANNVNAYGYLEVSSTAAFGFSSTTSYTGTKDSILCRLNAAGTIGVENAASCTNSLTGANGTFDTGIIGVTAAGAASTPSVSITGAPYTGGTGTTTVPLVYFNSGGTAPTSWNTLGTLLGFNAPSGFTGNFLDFHVNGGASLFSIGANGSVSAGGGSPTACGSATGCLALTEASTAGTPTAGNDYIRADITSHTLIYSINSSAEASLPGSVVAVPTPLTAQSANVTATTIYTTPAAAHRYLVCVEVDLTRAATTASTLPGIQVDYTSAVDSVGRVANIGFSSGNTGNGTYLANSACTELYAAASSAIQWATVSYASSGATAMQFAMSGTVQVIQ